MSGFWLWLIVALILWIVLTGVIVRCVRAQFFRAALYWGLLIGTLVLICRADDAFTAAGAESVHIVLFLAVLLLNLAAFVNVVRCAVLMGLRVEAEQKAAEAQSPAEKPATMTEAQQTNQWLGMIWFQAWDQRRRNRW